MTPRPSLPAASSAAVLAVFLASSAFVAIAGGLATVDGVASWYPALDKPPWTPPNWAFGPVWTTLYTLMAIAAWDLVRRSPSRIVPMVLYGVQLCLNLAWSPLFFAQHQTGAALAVIAGMWVAILACIVSFWPSSRLGAILLTPYLVWVSIATSLNAWIWWFN